MKWVIALQIGYVAVLGPHCEISTLTQIGSGRGKALSSKRRMKEEWGEEYHALKTNPPFQDGHK